MKTILATLAVVASFVGAAPVIVHAQSPDVSNDYTNYVRTDPDAFIRSQLQRDEQWKHGGAD